MNRRELLRGIACIAAIVVVPAGTPPVGAYAGNLDAVWDGVRWVPMLEIIDQRIECAKTITRDAIINNLYLSGHDPAIRESF